MYLYNVRKLFQTEKNEQPPAEQQPQEDGEAVENDEESGASAESNTPAPDLLIKHPLQNRWALWFFKNDKSKDWAANLKLVTTFDTVEDFWA